MATSVRHAQATPFARGSTTAFGTDYFTRAAVARSNIFVNKLNEAKYFYQDLDSSGKPEQSVLDGM